MMIGVCQGQPPETIDCADQAQVKTRHPLGPRYRGLRPFSGLDRTCSDAPAGVASRPREPCCRHDGHPSRWPLPRPGLRSIV